jgi:hypothetical protein
VARLPMLPIALPPPVAQRVMLRPPVHEAGWATRVIQAGVRLDLFESADDDCRCLRFA